MARLVQTNTGFPRLLYAPKFVAQYRFVLSIQTRERGVSDGREQSTTKNEGRGSGLLLFLRHFSVFCLRISGIKMRL